MRIVDDAFFNSAFISSVEEISCKEMAKDVARYRDGDGGSFPIAIAGHYQAAEERLMKPITGITNYKAPKERLIMLNAKC